MRRVSSAALPLVSALTLMSLISCKGEMSPPPAMSDADYIARGRYLTKIMACNDCHTPGVFYGAPDTTRLLSGSELGWKGPWGVTYARNLTPEPQTGIGPWSEANIIEALRVGKRPDGTMLLPPMPWMDYVGLTDDDATAIARYLKSIPPVMHQVPDRLPPGAPDKGAIIAYPPPPAWDAPRTATTPAAP